MLELFPGFADEAPIERRITRTHLPHRRLGGIVDYSSHALGHPVNGVTARGAVLRLVGKAEEAGALLMPGIRVDSLLTQGLHGRRQWPGSGPVTRSGRCRSSWRRTASTRRPGRRDCGGRRRPTTPRGRGEGGDQQDRFGVLPEGVAHAIVGDCTQGIGGAGSSTPTRVRCPWGRRPARCPPGVRPVDSEPTSSSTVSGIRAWSRTCGRRDHRVRRPPRRRGAGTGCSGRSPGTGWSWPGKPPG